MQTAKITAQCSAAARSAARPASSLMHAIKPVSVRGTAPLPLRNTSRLVAVQAKDFDTILMETANKFEKSDNKVAIVGWTAGVVGALVVGEWLINLPLFNVLLGFPIQLLGLVSAGNLAWRWYGEKAGEPLGDLEALVKKVSAELPGLGK